MRVGSLCTGILGAELALARMGWEPELAWYSEVDRDASRLLELRAPGVPNLGDLKCVEWERLERVDVVTAGYPCQPFSTAGKRAGHDDPRHLWPHILCALRVLRPGLVLLENVAVHLSLGFDRVLGDLAAVGFDAEWTTLRASDVEAAHQRDRLFVAAYPECQPVRLGARGVPGPERERERERMKGQNGNGFGLTLAMAARLIPTPGASGGGGLPETERPTGATPSRSTTTESPSRIGHGC